MPTHFNFVFMFHDNNWDIQLALVNDNKED